jgi:hypothetical protein
MLKTDSDRHSTISIAPNPDAQYKEESLSETHSPRQGGACDQTPPHFCIPREACSFGAAYGSPEVLLAEGWVAGAVVDGELVARAHTSCQSATYADVAISTREHRQGQGLATAAASMVCQQVQLHGCTPIWSTMVDNHASRQVAQKLRFTDYSQLTYVIAQTASS